MTIDSFDFCTFLVFDYNDSVNADLFKLQDTFKKYLDTDTFKTLHEKSI